MLGRTRVMIPCSSHSAAIIVARVCSDRTGSTMTTSSMTLAGENSERLSKSAYDGISAAMEGFQAGPLLIDEARNSIAEFGSRLDLPGKLQRP